MPHRPTLDESLRLLARELAEANAKATAVPLARRCCGLRRWVRYGAHGIGFQPPLKCLPQGSGENTEDLWVGSSPLRSLPLTIF